MTVLAQVDLKRLKFKKVDGRNRNDLTVVSAVFDRNGNYLTGNQKIVQIRLRDETLKTMMAPMTVRTSFDVKPGDYLVRLVVRDAEEQLMSTRNAPVEVPSGGAH